MTKINWFIFFLCLGTSFFAQQKRAFFLGNSYTFYNSLPSLVNQIANPLGDTLIFESNTPGGYTLESHSTNAQTLNKIAEGTWDYVAIQGQSQKSSFPPAQVAVEVYPFAAVLVDSIRSANSCAEPLFFMTWGRENGDQINGQQYPPIATYEGMQARLRTSYMQMATSNNATVSPVGATWKYVRNNYPNIDLYTSDESHPSLAGSYLAACVFYSSIFKKSPEGSSFTAGLPATTVIALQEATKKVVIDSLSTWRIGHNHVEIDTIIGTANSTTEYSFSANVSNATDYSWSFSNGQTATEVSPTIDFGSLGNYTVALIANNSCFSDSTSVVIATNTSIEENKILSSISRDNFTLKMNFLNYKNKYISAIDLAGRLIIKKEFNSNYFELNIQELPSLFLLKIKEGNNVQTLKIKK